MARAPRKKRRREDVGWGHPRPPSGLKKAAAASLSGGLELKWAMGGVLCFLGASLLYPCHAQSHGKYGLAQM